jgi:hypothetical protein
VAGLIGARGRISKLLVHLWGRSSLIIIIIGGYTLFNMVGFAHYRLRYPLEWLVLIFAGWGIANILAFIPMFKEPLSPRNEYPLPHCGYTMAFLAFIFLFFCISITVARNTNSRRIAAICEAPSQEQQALSYFSMHYPDLMRNLNRDIGYRQAWQSQMEHMGDLTKYRGTIVCWTGEASFIRGLSLEQIAEEPAAYRDAWNLADPGAGSPCFIRLVIDSYAHPGELGEGEVLIICEKQSAIQIRDGDRVSVLAEISGADRQTMGYIIAFGHAFYRWDVPGGV